MDQLNNFQDLVEAGGIEVIESQRKKMKIERNYTMK